MRLWRFVLAYALLTLSLAQTALAVHWHAPGWAVWSVAQALIFAVILLAEVQRRRRSRRAGWKPFGPI